MIGARIKPAFEAEARERRNAGVNLQANLPEGQKGQARDQAAAAVNVSPRLVESASKVQKNGTPKLVEMVGPTMSGSSVQAGGVSRTPFTIRRTGGGRERPLTPAGRSATLPAFQGRGTTGEPDIRDAPHGRVPPRPRTWSRRVTHEPRTSHVYRSSKQ
jgi:hypothetical protein